MIKVCNVCGLEKEHKSWKSYTCNDCLTNGQKYCPSCNETHPISNFHKNGQTLRSYCKQCEIKRSMEGKNNTNYYSRPSVREKRNEDSRLCKQAQYMFDEEYRAKELIRCSERRSIVTAKSITSTEWLDTLEAFDNSCAYCGSKHKLTMDHVVPVSKGGQTTIDNIIPACGSCNFSKQAEDIVVWYTRQIFYSEERLVQIQKFLRSRR